MRWLVLLAIACGHSSPPPPVENSKPPPPLKDTRTTIEQRRDKACEVVAKRVTQCAVDDAKKDLAAGKVKKEQFDKDTAPEVVAKNAEQYADKCKAKNDYSSRQIRVLEKCPEYETECEPFLKCLENLAPQH